jgi:hypothetical protein
MWDEDCAAFVSGHGGGCGLRVSFGRANNIGGEFRLLGEFGERFRIDERCPRGISIRM